MMMNAVTLSLGQALSIMVSGGMGVGTGSPQDMIQFGLGVGMALMQSGAFKGFEPVTLRVLAGCSNDWTILPVP